MCLLCDWVTRQHVTRHWEWKLNNQILYKTLNQILQDKSHSKNTIHELIEAHNSYSVKSVPLAMLVRVVVQKTRGQHVSVVVIAIVARSSFYANTSTPSTNTTTSTNTTWRQGSRSVTKIIVVRELQPHTQTHRWSWMIVNNDTQSSAQ